MSDEPLGEEWLKREVFEKAGIPARLELPLLRGSPPPLGSERQPRRAPVPVGLIGAPLRGYRALPPLAALRVGTYSRYNLFHALLVRNIVLHLAEVGYLPKLGEPNNAIGAVAPYASQTKLIQTLLEDRLGTRAAGLVATVHRFQGNEKAAMLLDLTDSFGAPLSRFLKAVRIEEDGARLLNVAVSRARHHVLLVGNFAYLRSKASDGAIVRRLIDHFEECGGTTRPRGPSSTCRARLGGRAPPRAAHLVRAP